MVGLLHMLMFGMLKCYNNMKLFFGFCVIALYFMIPKDYIEFQGSIQFQIFELLFLDMVN